ncbi:hypothetical protein HDV05_002982, partial [Chytridiales sp. JEL 0842]
MSYNTSSPDYRGGEASGIEAVFFYGLIMGCTSQCLMQTSFLRRGKGAFGTRTLLYIGLLITFLISFARSIFLIVAGATPREYNLFELSVDHIFVVARMIAFYVAFVRVNAFLGNSYGMLKKAFVWIVGLAIFATRIADRSLGLFFAVNNRDPRRTWYRTIRLNLKNASLWMFLISVFFMNVTLVYFLFNHVREMNNQNDRKAVRRIQEVLI